MKKILSTIISAIIIIAVVTIPSSAQTAQKSNVVKPRSEMSAKLDQRTRKAKGGSLLNKRQRGAKNVFSKTKNGPAFARKNTRRVVKAEANLPELYGSVIYSDNEAVYEGLYSVNTSIPMLQFSCNGLNGGAIVTDNIYWGVSYYVYFGYVFGGVYAYDLETQEVVYNGEDEATAQMISTAGYAKDPISGNVYGLCYNEDGTSQVLSTIKFDLESGLSVEAIAEVEGFWDALAINSKGQMYGIKTDEDKTQSCLYTIDKTTGQSTPIGDTGVVAAYLGGAVIDQSTDRMFWAVSDINDDGYLVEVDLVTGAATLVIDYTYNDEVVGLYIPEPEAKENAPGACGDVKVNFEGGALSGNVILTAPSTLFDGSEGSGELIVLVFANGEQVGYLETQWGAECTVPVDLSLMGAGKYEFIVFASNENGEGPKTRVKDVFVGADVPAATTATLTYANGNMEVNWLPVTEGLNGGYVDASSVTYRVMRADGTIAADGLTTTSFAEAITEPEVITTFYYTVYAVCGDLESAGAETNIVVLGSVVPPYTSDYAADLEGYTILDNNNDQYGWYESNGNMKIHWNADEKMDDWFITIPFLLEGGKSYMVSFAAWGEMPDYPERLEVRYGTDNTAAAMTNVLVEPTVITGLAVSKQTFSVYLQPETSGKYYIGFHGISDADQYYLTLGNFTIENGISSSAPAAVSDLTASADLAGAYRTTVTFTAPDKTMSGETLDSISKIEILRGGNVVKVFDDVTPGETLMFDDELTSAGSVEYTVTAYNESGQGVPATVSVFVGFEKAKAPAVVNIARGAAVGSVILTWTPVTEDVGGKQLPEGSVTYKILKEEQNSYVVVATLPDTTYTFQAVAEGEQDFVQAYVLAIYDGAEGEGTWSDMIAVGTPYSGLDESGEFGKYIWGINTVGGGSWMLLTDDSFSDMQSADGDGVYFAMKGDALDAFGEIFTGLVSLEKLTNPGLTFETYNFGGEEPGEEDKNEIAVSILADGQREWTEIYRATVDEICGGSKGWGRMTIGLGEFAGKVVQVKFTAVTASYTYTTLDGLKIADVLGYDLAAKRIKAPERVKTGSEYQVSVSVENNGSHKAAGWSVELYADEEQIAVRDGQELTSGAKATVTFEQVMSPLAEDPVSFYAVVKFADDNELENNLTETVQVTPVVSTLPTAHSLEAENTLNGVLLKWEEPQTNTYAPSKGAVTDDFEDADAFVSAYGDWTFVDVDDSLVGGFDSIEVPNIEVGVTRGSFWIWDQSLLGNESFEAHSGNKFLFAMYRYDDGATDDWAISPELNGDAQEIDFWAKSYVDYYPEKIEVYYSTTGKDISDFKLVEGSTVARVPDQWTNYAVELPYGTKYFAIRSCATASFMLMIDDVTYVPASVAPTPLRLEGYNVYRNGDKLNSDLVEASEYTDTNVGDGEVYSYVVTAVYETLGESAGSNVVSILCDTSGMNGISGLLSVQIKNNDIIICNADGKAVTVVGGDGVVYYTGAGKSRTVIKVRCGVYVVKVGDKVVKAVVR